MKNLRVYNSSEQYESMLDNIVVPAISRILTDQSHKVRWLNDNYYDDKYLKFTALEDGTFTFTMYSALTVANFTYAAYSLDDGATWTRADNVASTVVTLTTPTVHAGDKVLWKGKGLRVNTATSNTSVNGMFSSTGHFDVSGNIMSILFEDDFSDKKSTVNTNAFSGLFQGCTYLVNAENLLLPATTLTNYCYFCLFRNCSSLITTPKLDRAKSIPSYAYGNMFQGCTSLMTTPELPATTLTGTYAYSAMFSSCTNLQYVMKTLPATSLSNYCYQYMFDGCTSLPSTPTLPATTVSSYGYYYMFRGCTSLSSTPTLSATTVNNYGYAYMFYGCTNLTNINPISATSVKNYSMSNMFQNCTSITTMPNLSATSLGIYCYQSMFYGCTKLVNVMTTLPATTLEDYCYYQMFRGCSSMTTAPILPATTLKRNCYASMFFQCSKLNNITMLATSLDDNLHEISQWVYNVSTSGTFTMNGDAQWYKRGLSGIPKNWTIQYNNSSPTAQTYMNNYVSQRDAERDNNYFYTQALSSGTITLNIKAGLNASHYTYVEYSKDKVNWTRTTNNTSAKTIAVAVAANEKVYWRGPTDYPWSSQLGINATNYSWFTSTCNFSVGGKLISLLDGNIRWDDIDVYQYYGYTFTKLFQGNTYLVDASKLILPNTTVSYCYQYMFDGCTNLTRTPQLCSCDIITYAYSYMFQNCTSLAESPEIYSSRCFGYGMYYMFNGCTGLVDAHDIHTTSLEGNYDCAYMFQNCTALLETPAFAPTTLSSYCCNAMFNGCSSLTTAMSELPATTLATYCYRYMFQGCTSLTAAPVLKATSWVNYCYQYMFKNCSSLTYIKCMATSAPTVTNHTLDWVNGVAATGTFIRNTTKWTATGVNSIPVGWTVQSA